MIDRTFKLGDMVRKIKGAQWAGRVVGWYATKLTPEGYAVESATECGSVQIYPVAALEADLAQEPVTCNPPFGSKRKAAMAIYTPPFKFYRGYVYDSQHNMVADDSDVDGAVAARVRGWGRIGYMPDADAIQDEVGQVIADALNAYYAAPQEAAAPVDLPDDDLADLYFNRGCHLHPPGTEKQHKALIAFARAAIAKATGAAP